MMQIFGTSIPDSVTFIPSMVPINWEPEPMEEIINRTTT